MCQGKRVALCFTVYLVTWHRSLTGIYKTIKLALSPFPRPEFLDCRYHHYHSAIYVSINNRWCWRSKQANDFKTFHRSGELVTNLTWIGTSRALWFATLYTQQDGIYKANSQIWRRFHLVNNSRGNLSNKWLDVPRTQSSMIRKSYTIWSMSIASTGWPSRGKSCLVAVDQAP